VCRHPGMGIACAEWHVSRHVIKPLRLFGLVSDACDDGKSLVVLIVRLSLGVRDVRGVAVVGGS